MPMWIKINVMIQGITSAYALYMDLGFVLSTHKQLEPRGYVQRTLATDGVGLTHFLLGDLNEILHR